MTVTLDWLGCATFRLTIDGLVLFLDTFMDRVPTAPEVGLRSTEVSEADFVLIGHSHFDHLAGADVIAKETGAKVIGSNETARVLLEAGVPEEQLLRSQGGEHHRLADGVSVRVYPSLHSCIWTRAAPPGTDVTGDLGLTEEEREAVRASQPQRYAPRDPELAHAARELREHSVSSSSIGGALDYLIETPEGSIFFQDSMGYWTGIMREIKPDVAILAASGRGNIDGEPIQGSVEQFVGREAELLRPHRIVLGHHDNWTGIPDRPDIVDITPIREQLARVAPDAELLEVDYLEGTALF